MADEIKEFSQDEVSSLIYQGSPSQGMMMPSQQMSPSAPSAPVAPPSLAMPSKGKASASLPDPTQLLETVSKANQQLKENAAPPEPPSAINGLVDQITGNWKPLAIGAGAAYALTRGPSDVKRVGSAAVDMGKRMMSRSGGPVIESVRIDPTFASDVEMRQAEVAAQKAAPTLTPLQNLQQRSDDLKAAVQGKAPVVPPQFGPAGAGVGVPPSPPYQPISTPLSSAPVDAPAPMPSAKPGSAVTEIVADTLKELINEPVAPLGELRTGTGKPAFAGTGPEAEISAKTGKPKLKPEYATLADVPQGYALVPEGQYIDALRQDLGQAAYTKAFTGQDFPGTYEQAQAMGKEINRDLGRPTREAAKAAGLPPAEITPGITKMTSSGKKGVNVKALGLTGALVALSDLAKADTPNQRAMASANLLEAILPPGFMMGGAGEGSSALPSADAAMLLGSPYAQSEIAKKRRQQEEYTRKVGAGRGIAFPSAYVR